MLEQCELSDIKLIKHPTSILWDYEQEGNDGTCDTPRIDYREHCCDEITLWVASSKQVVTEHCIHRRECPRVGAV